MPASHGRAPIVGLPAHYRQPYTAAIRLRLLRPHATFTCRVDSQRKHDELFAALRGGDLGPVTVHVITTNQEHDDDDC